MSFNSLITICVKYKYFFSKYGGAETLQGNRSVVTNALLYFALKILRLPEL